MAVEVEPMQRVTLIFTLDQGLLEAEGKSATNGRLFSNEFRKGDAAAYLAAITGPLAAAVAAKQPIELPVDRSTMTLLPIPSGG
jgi:hypothetical protein